MIKTANEGISHCRVWKTWRIFAEEHWSCSGGSCWPGTFPLIRTIMYCAVISHSLWDFDPMAFAQFQQMLFAAHCWKGLQIISPAWGHKSFKREIKTATQSYNKRLGLSKWKRQIQTLKSPTAKSSWGQGWWLKKRRERVCVGCSLKTINLQLQQAGQQLTANWPSGCSLSWHLSMLICVQFFDCPVKQLNLLL